MFRKRRPPIASRPGTLVIDAQAPPPKIHLIRYTTENVDEFDVEDVEQLPRLLGAKGVTWIDVQGLGDEAVLKRIAQIFSLHSLAIADVANVPQRPKTELYEEHLFLVTRMAHLREGVELDVEQVSIFLGHHYVLTFQERYGGMLEALRARIQAGKGPIRQQGPDYLAYAVLDAVIDGYYPILESLGEYLADLEDEALEAQTKSTLRKTNRARGTLLNLRRTMWPQREALNSLIRDQSSLISDAVRLYLRDCQDHCVQISEVIDSYREVVSAVANTYLSAVSNRTNDTMKVLTIMASIFIPLTFMAGIYGMNFEYMPELHYRYAYAVLWFAMAAVAIGMMIYFYRKGWIGSAEKDKEDVDES